MGRLKTPSLLLLFLEAGGSNPLTSESRVVAHGGRTAIPPPGLLSELLCCPWREMVWRRLLADCLWPDVVPQADLYRTRVSLVRLLLKGSLPAEREGSLLQSALGGAQKELLGFSLAVCNLQECCRRQCRQTGETSPFQLLFGRGIKQALPTEYWLLSQLTGAWEPSLCSREFGWLIITSFPPSLRGRRWCRHLIIIKTYGVFQFGCGFLPSQSGASFPVHPGILLMVYSC